MSEFRQNYATREWVIIAPERQARPADLPAEATAAGSAGGEAAAATPDSSAGGTAPAATTAAGATPAAGAGAAPAVAPPGCAAHVLSRDDGDLRAYEPDCPFCPGNEDETAEEMWAMRDGAGDWKVRVVRNRFAPLDLTRSVHRSQVGRFLKSDSYGTAEVVIESPRHDMTPAEMSHADLVHVLEAYRDRAIAMSAMPNISIVMIFRNAGARAGTSLAHPHSQIIASPIIPPHIRDPFQKAALHYDSYGTCVYCDMLAEELRQGERIVYANDAFVVFCPFASRTPYELRIYPRRHMASYTWISDAELPLFARALREALQRIDAVLGRPSYNYIIRSSPVGDEDVRYLHWYFVLVPRVSTPAGFEIGSGIYINPCAPEQCASELRAVKEASTTGAR